MNQFGLLEQVRQLHLIRLKKYVQQSENASSKKYMMKLQLKQLGIQYGGSMNAGNARELLAKPDIDGGLVGGASLKTRFWQDC